MNLLIKKAIDVLGSQAELARAIGKSGPFIHGMLHNNKAVPAALCIGIEAASGGAVTRYELRPDVFGEKPTKKPSKKTRAA